MKKSLLIMLLVLATGLWIAGCAFTGSDGGEDAQQAGSDQPQAEQQETVNRLTEKNGESFVRQYVLKPGYSEYHTGLALNLSLIMNGKNVYKTKDMVLYPDTWAVIHAHLAEYGFILRYPYEKKDVTGFGYEAWHIRYVGAAAAKAMEEQGLALEEYVEMLGQ